MIRNFLTVAIRNLLRHKLYTSINVLGLAIGLAGGILILLYINQESSIDRFYTLGDRIYKVIREVRGTTRTTESGTSGALGPAFPEVGCVGNGPCPHNTANARASISSGW